MFNKQTVEKKPTALNFLNNTLLCIGRELGIVVCIILFIYMPSELWETSFIRPFVSAPSAAPCAAPSAAAV